MEETFEILHCYDSENSRMQIIGMRCDIGIKSKLGRAIDYYAPDILFIQPIKDMHPDNTMTGLMAANALKEHRSQFALFSP